MKNNICENLINLAKAFEKKKSTLYIVGGFCRNHFCGFEQGDIDICGALLPDQVQKLCEKLNFDCKVVNKKLGTLLISVGSDKFEYTTFRKENYPNSGAHSPQDVEFVADLVTDAKRRDFTVNCIYYDILKNEFTDIYGGINDVKKKLIKCVETPQFVFSSDGLRLLRMVRFAVQLGFKIERKTFKVAKANGFLLKDISVERITKELKEMFHLKYGNKKVCGIILLNKLNYFKHIFTLSYPFKIKNNYAYKSFLKADDELKFVSFLILILLNYFKFKTTSFNNVVFSINRLFGNNGIRCGEDLNSLAKIYAMVQTYLFGTHNANMFATYHNLNGMEKCVVNVFCDKKYLSLGVLKLKNNNVPLNEKMLNISNVLLLENVNHKNINAIKKALLQRCLNGEVENKEETLLMVAKVLDKKLNNKIK